MRHHNANRKLGRKRDQRKALLRSLARELFVQGKIVTTDAKAREVKSFAEKLITKARVATLASRRVVSAKMANNDVIEKLVKEIAPKYKDRTGGYTRLTKLSPRLSDGSKMAAVELI